MHDLGAETKYDTRNLAKPATSAWRVYKRLIRYALHYKGRLAVALLFSVLTAASFGTMLATLGTTISILTWAPERPPIPAPDTAAVASDVAATTVSAPMDSTADRQDGATKPEKVRKPRKDPAESIAEQIASITGGLHDKLGWAPEGLDTGFWNVVTEMRTDRMYAMKVITVIMILLAAISGFASFLQEYFAASIGANISVRLGEQMYENVIRSSLRFFEERHTGEIMARFTNDIFMVNRGLAGVFVKLMSEPIKAIVFLSIALSMNVGLTLVGLCVLPPVAIVVVRIGKKVKKSVRRSLEKVASMASVVNESVSGITIVKGFCMEDYEIGRLKTEIQKLRRYLLQMVKADAIVGPSTEFILITGVVLFALLSVSQILSGKLDAGNLTALSGALVAMMDPLRKISSVNNAIQASVASAERIFEFIDLKPDVVEATNAVDLPVIQKSLRFENVRFAYNATTEVLRGIDLEIKKGEMIAIVGFSGAGKSTVAKLIPRFYDVTGGAITVDGVDIRDASFRSLRAQISIVTQDTVLFNETVRANIAFGQSNYSDAKVREAARAAYAQEFIEKMAKGYDTPIGESGTMLSGGQRQRLAIARALVKDPSILILDEATSSLDSESEQMIQKALEEFVVGRTTIVIAHRLSTIQRADRIVVLDNGVVAEIGTHQELLDHGGIYRRLYEIQFRTPDGTNGDV